ncbi:MAG TPA: hypothetical protein VFA94_07140 [Acidimicrobiales bacterium]|nr:hypothetical protein [Acidimicrobiales bacterium]
MRVRPALAGLGALAVASLAVVLTSTPAGAIVKGPCRATVNGIDVAPLPVDDPSNAIKVHKDDTITYDVTSPVRVRSRSFVLSFAGINLTVDSGSSSQRGGSDGRSGAVVVDDYAWMGAGLYQVAGVAHLENGQTCSGAVLIDVQGNPLGTVSGAVGLILTVLGGAGILVGTIRRGGGRLVRDLVDLIELGGVDLGDAAAGTPGQEPAATAAATAAGGTASPAEAPEKPESPETSGEPPGTKRRPTGPVAVPVVPTTPTGIAPATPVTPPTPPVAVGAGASGAGTSGSGSSGDGASSTGDEAPKPPPLPGMATVAAVGSTGKALTEAAEQLEGSIANLPISDEQKEKLTETLGIDKIKEKLGTVTEVTDTVEHFEAMGTETVDTMNRWGVNANGINGLLWLRTMTEASGRLGQKFADDLVKPVIEPVTEAAGKAGIEVDADEVAHTLLPIQETAEEASKALLTAGKNVLGGDNVLNQLGQDPVVDEEWRAIRSFE